MKPRLILRADGNERIGLGHVMRLLALAEIAGDAFERVFVVRPSLPAATRDELSATGSAIVELPESIPLAAEVDWLSEHVLCATDVVILDGYNFEFAYQQHLRKTAGALLYIDDLVGFPQAADVVLNPAGGVLETDYDLRRAGSRLLSGPAWAPLRRPFRETAQQVGTVAPAGQLLLCLGGADPANRTHQLATELLRLPGIEHLHVVVGSAYDHWETLHHWASKQDASQLTLHRALPATAFRDLLAACGAALTSASTISYEYASVGGGLLTVVQTADNQRRIYNFLLHEGMARPATALPNMLSAPDRSHIQATLRIIQRRHFDGEAPERLQRVLFSLAAQTTLRLRPATPADAEQLLQWANDAVVRQHSYNSALITHDDHRRWLPAKLSDTNHLLLIATVADRPAGTIRFALDVTTHSATLSFALDAYFRGLGLGTPLLLAGATAASQYWGQILRRLVGHVLSTNEASLRAFRRAGFTEWNNPAPPADSVSFELLVS